MKNYLLKNKKKLILILIFIVIQSLLSILIALSFQYLINAATRFEFKNFKKYIIFLFLVSLINCINSFVLNIFEAKLINKIMINLKNELLIKIFNKDIYEINKQSKGKYISNITNDMFIMENNYFYCIFNIVSGIINFILSLIALFYLNYILGFIGIILSILLSLLTIIPKSKLQILKNNYSQALIDLTSKIKNSLDGIEIIKNFNSEEFFINECKKKVNNEENIKYKYNKFFILINNTFSFLGFLNFLIIITTSSYLVLEKKLSIGVMIAAIQLMNNINSPIQIIISSINKINSTKKIRHNLETIIYNKNENFNNVKCDKFKEMELNNVECCFNNLNPVIKNINFKIKRGNKILIVGSSGSGKTTLLKIMLGIAKISAGSVNINHKNINLISKKHLYKMISIISQNVLMFETSLKNNITLYENFNEQEIKYWFEFLEVDHILKKFEHNLNVNINENSNKLSGGEKQIICIIRSLIRKSQLLLIDEMNSSLDNKLTYNIENKLLNIKDLTIISVTHKLNKNILKKYDNIIVLENGEIVEQGKFYDLIKREGYFCKLYKI